MLSKKIFIAVLAAVLTIPAPAQTPTYVKRSGDTMTGPLTLPGDPTSSNQAATKNYVDTHAGTPGATGPAGAAATVTVGSVTTGAPGTSAAVTNSGTSSAAVLNFTIPQGQTGATGASGSGGSGSVTVLAPVAYNAYGDSITACTFSPGITCYVNRIASALSIASPHDYGVSGAQACDVALSFLPVDVPSVAAQQPLRTVMIGTNDANNQGVGAYEATFNTCWQGVVSYMAVPIQDKTLGGTVFSGGTYTGTCASDTTYAPATGIDCTSSAATATFSITTTGGPIYIWPRVIDSDAGTWEYSLDGGAAVAETTALTTAMATTNQGASSKSIGFIRITGVAAGTHTIVFTKTNATGDMAILAVGTPPSTPNVSGPSVIVGDLPNELSGGAGAATLSEYDSDIYADANLLSGDGLVIFQAYPSKYVQATSAAADMVNTLHPNAVGNGELEAAFMATNARLVPGQQTPVGASGLPTFVAANSYFSSGNATTSTPSATCPVGHVLVLAMSGNAQDDTITLTTTTTNTINSIVSNYSSAAAPTISAWYVNCDGSTGTYTATISGSSKNGYLTTYEANGGHYDSYGICAGNTASCSMVEKNYGLALAAQMAVASSKANASVAAWTNRLNNTDNSWWDSITASGVVTFPVNYDGGGKSDTLMINLKP
jgi:hypothetical protein